MVIKKNPIIENLMKMTKILTMEIVMILRMVMVMKMRMKIVKMTLSR